jgi:hypothetical protein
MIPDAPLKLNRNAAGLRYKKLGVFSDKQKNFSA